MYKYSFTNDYSEGCHPNILEALSQTNLFQQNGYGDDEYSNQARCIIRKLIQDENAAIHFVSGGTIANLIVLASIMKPFESVIAATSGHINTHETGAIEATGHKIESVSTLDGKLRPQDIIPILDKSPEYHTVKPRVVYISNSTEIGTIYSKQELITLSEFCRQNDLILFMDGARLASAITSSKNDLSLADIAKLVDVFYLGGTKIGALLGEAIIITNNNLKSDFQYHIKQRGGMMAKGRVLGLQFSTLLQNGLMFDLATHANNMAFKIVSFLQSISVSFLTESDTNQIFPILPNSVIEKLHLEYNFYIWESINEDMSAIRLVTSWSTPEEKVDLFIQDLEKYLGC